VNAPIPFPSDIGMRRGARWFEGGAHEGTDLARQGRHPLRHRARPKIQEGRDAIIKVTACAICGSDLHLMGGFVPTMEKGDVLGHETMGEVVEVGKDNTKLKVGDRVVVPFTICCGECRQCKWGNWSCCERTNPNAAMQAKVLGFPSAGMFGYSHLTGGIPGGQAEYLRVPYADVGPVKVPEASPTSRCCSSPTSSPPRIWRPSTARSRPKTPSPSGGAVRSAYSASSPASCSAPSASSPSTA
jgi:hypothetical protein